MCLLQTGLLQRLLCVFSHLLPVRFVVVHVQLIVSGRRWKYAGCIGIRGTVWVRIVQQTLAMTGGRKGHLNRSQNHTHCVNGGPFFLYYIKTNHSIHKN